MTFVFRILTLEKEATPETGVTEVLSADNPPITEAVQLASEYAVNVIGVVAPVTVEPLASRIITTGEVARLESVFPLEEGAVEKMTFAAGPTVGVADAEGVGVGVGVAAGVVGVVPSPEGEATVTGAVSLSVSSEHPANIESASTGTKKGRPRE